MLVREAGDADLDALVAVFVAAFAAPPWSEQWPADAARQRLDDLLRTPRSVALCAEDDDGVVAGLLLAHRERASDADHLAIHELCVSPGRRREGIARSLVDALDERTADVESTYLLTMRESSAADFWAAVGFRPARRQTVLVRP